MIRGLKTLFLASILLGALNVAGAQAAEFHCSVEPCRVTVKPDGTKSAAHQSFIIKDVAVSAGFTCSGITGEGTLAAKTSSQLTLTNLAYQSCSIIGTEVAVKMNGCDYLFSAAGQFSIKCPEGKKIEWIILNCPMTIGSQGPLPLVGKFIYRDPAGTKSELTVESAVQGIKGTVDANPPFCSIKPGEFTEAEITTGNFVLTAESDNAEAKLANIWWE